MKTSLWPLFPILLFILACNNNSSPEIILKETQTKLSSASSISYNYQRFTDNRFNTTTYLDSAEVTYFQKENSLYGFGLHALSNQEEYLFDGYSFQKLKHLSKVRVIYDEEEIAKDSSYFNNFSFFFANPMSIEDYPNLANAIDTVIEDQPYFLFKNEVLNKSHTDSTKIVSYQKFFYLNRTTKEIDQIQDRIIRDGDTLQVVDHYFTGYSYNNHDINFPEFSSSDISKYKTISEEDEYGEFTYTPIREGETITKKTYVDINNKEIDIYGIPGKSSLIMFSFIGCTPCEIALNDFKEVKYNFTNTINLYYSSFQNTNNSLKIYLHKKAFPFTGFGKESDMINEFSLYTAPSFALIDSKGEVLKVIEGYDDEVRAYLFDLLLIE